MRNHLLALTRRTIPYSPELRSIAGSVTASILMQQLDYWFSKMPDGFYKFLSPCNNEAYKPGDSWEEELAFSADEFRTAFDRIGVRHISKKAYKAAESSSSVFLQALKDGTFEEKFYASYHDKIKGLTFYFRNHPLTDAALDALTSKSFSVNREIPSTEMKTPTPPATVTGQTQSTEMDIPRYVSGESSVHLYQEITQETTHTRAHEEKKEEQSKNGGRPPAPNINSLVSQGVSGHIKQSTVICEDNFPGAAVATTNYAALGMQDPNDRKTRQMREFNWVPDGPWKVDNKLDNNFVDWLTAKWVRDFGRDVHSTRANVQRHLKKDAANFAIAWDEYHREHLHRFSNAAVRERSGGVLSPEEQQKLLQHSAAVTQAVPEELASVAYTLPSAVEEFTPDIAAKLNGSAPALPQGAENPDCYQIYKPAESVADISPEEAAANIKKLREMMQSMGGKRVMPKIEPSKPKSVVEDLMADLEDPAIRFSVDVQARAQRLVGTDDGWCADYNEQGKIVAIYRF